MQVETIENIEYSLLNRKPRARWYPTVKNPGKKGGQSAKGLKLNSNIFLIVEASINLIFTDIFHNFPPASSGSGRLRRRSPSFRANRACVCVCRVLLYRAQHSCHYESSDDKVDL